MKNVKIDDVLCRDWGLILTSAVIGNSELKTVTIDIPGKDGVLDCTDALYGRAMYKNRKITLNFQTTDKLTGMNWITLQDKLTEQWHGKMVKITFMDRPDKYYKGRMEVKSFEASGKLRIIQMEADCEPALFMDASGSGGTIS